jgi:hypothetical protein
MVRVLPSLLIISLAGCAASQQKSSDAPGKVTASYRVHDLTPTFWKYWDGAEKLPVEEQVRLFVEQVVAAHPDVYTPHVIGLKADEPMERALLRRWPRFLGFVGAQLPLARKLSSQIGRELPNYDARFRKAFPDFAYTGDVYFLVSIGAMDGGTRKVNGKVALLFGVDVIARVYGDDADPESFFHHELFHLYQEQFPDPDLEDTIAQSLWREGLAVYVADQMVPGTPESVLLGLPLSSPARIRSDLGRYAEELRAQLDSKSPEEYKKWFTGGGDTAEPPGRGGYTLGYLVVKEIARGRSPAELARLRGPELRRELDQGLRKLAAGGK